MTSPDPRLAAVALALLTACTPTTDDVAITHTQPRPDARVTPYAAQPTTTTTRVKVRAASVTRRRPPTRDIWWQLALCESGGRQRATSPSGRYLGYFQFWPPTWRAYGGTGDPRDHDYDTQLAVAKRVLAGQGWGAWPTCARKLGLI